MDLNEKIGATTSTAISSLLAPSAIRCIARPFERAYYAGSGGLGTVPMLHTRPYTDAIGDIHDRHRDFTIRARLKHANGNANNQVIWVGPPRPVRGEDAPATPVQGANLSSLSLETMTQWLDAMAADSSKLSLRKVVKHKPKAAVDACFTETGEKIPEAMTFDSKGKCNTLYPVHSEPRMIAGSRDQRHRPCALIRSIIVIQVIYRRTKQRCKPPFQRRGYFKKPGVGIAAQVRIRVRS